VGIVYECVNCLYFSLNQIINLNIWNIFNKQNILLNDNVLFMLHVTCGFFYRIIGKWLWCIGGDGMKVMWSGHGDGMTVMKWQQLCDCDEVTSSSSSSFELLTSQISSDRLLCGDGDEVTIWQWLFELDDGDDVMVMIWQWRSDEWVVMRWRWRSDGDELIVMRSWGNGDRVTVIIFTYSSLPVYNAYVYK